MRIAAVIPVVLVSFVAGLRGEVTIPNLGTPARVFSEARPTGSFVKLDVVPGGGERDAARNAVSWMPKSARKFEIHPSADGQVRLTLGMTLRWDKLPQNSPNGDPQDVRRYFFIGWTADGTNITWSPGVSAYVSSGYEGNLNATPEGKWVRIEHQYTFTVPMADNGKPIRWFVRDERTLNVANYQGQVLAPFSVSIDNVSIFVNEQSITQALGTFDFSDSDLNRNWQFWDGRTGSTQRIAPAP